MLFAASHRLRAASHLVVSLAAALLPVAAAGAQEANEEVNTGQDVTKPVRRVDFRINLSESVGGENAEAYVLRHDSPFKLANGDSLNFRLDLPFVRNSLPSLDNPDGSSNLGFGDVLVQALYIHPVSKSEALGFGTQLIVPTAGEDRFGGGKWRMVPTVGYRWSLPRISKGSFFVAAVRYDFSFAGDDDRPDIRVLQWSPTLNIGLPNATFLTFYPSTEMRYDFENDSLFIPADVSLGKLWNGRIVTSIEVAHRIIADDFAPYKWKAEFRLGYFF